MGFLVYIPEAGAHAFLDKVKDLSAPGSLYTSDIWRNLDENSEASKLMEKLMRENGSPAEFFIDNAEGEKV
jgi:O-methyltransferase involved in polyketide biosynthesis